jgi:titin
VSGTPRTVPGVPTGVVVTPGNGSLAVSWVAPASTGGAAITSYQVSTNGGASWIGVVAPATSTTVTGLVNGRSYRVRVRAVNPAGAGSSTSSVTARPVAS